MRNKLVGALVAGGLAAGLFGVPASADPVKSENATIIPLVCDNGQTYQVVVTGSGHFTPAHVIGSNAIFVPVAFGNITGTAVPSGAPAFFEPSSTKGQSAKNKDLTTCTFETTFPVSPEEVEEFGLPAGTTAVHVVGTVTGFFTPARG
ncbi:MAG TPA: hypothetical protein VHG90_08340 [Acidimicrobiales bacterium]|nr:hypothetical protein [Acidimicrobiales bacterium]